MAYAPTLLDDVARALEAFPDGISVKDLTAELDQPEMNVRRALDALLRKKTVTRRKAEAVGMNKPPYLYSLAPDKEPEIPTMPSINDAPPEDQENIGQEQDPGFDAPGGEADDDAGQDGGDQGQGSGQEQEDEGRSPGGREGGFQRRTPLHVAPRKSAQAALDTLARREVTEAEADQARRGNHKVGGTRRIERVDPIPPNFPQEEKGMLGRPVELSSLSCPLEEYIQRQYGGGSFLVHPCGNAGEPYTGGRVLQYDIAGPPIPVTSAGRAWRRKYDARVEGDQTESQGGKVPDFMTMMEMFDRKARESRQEANQQFQQTLQLLSPKPEAAAASAQSLETLRAGHREEMEKVRTDAEKRVQDVKDSAAAQAKKYEEDIRALRDEVRNTKTDLTNAWTKEKSELQVQHLAKVAEVEKHSAEKLQEVKDQAAKDLVAVKDAAIKDIATSKKESQQEARIKALEEKPKDINTQVQTAMIPNIIKIATEQAKRAAGIDQETGPETMMDALKEAVVEAGPEVMKRVANGIMNIVEARQGARPGAVPARPGTVPARPGIPKRPGAIPARPGAGPAPTAPRSPAPTVTMGGHGLLRERGGPAAAPPPPPVILTEEEQAALLLNPPAPAPEVIDVQAIDHGDMEETTHEGQTIEESLTERPQGEPVQEEPTPLTPAQVATQERLRTWFEILLTEMQIDSEATEVWVQPIPNTTLTVEDLYYKLPGPARKAMSEAEPDKAYAATLAALGVVAQDDPLLEAIQDHLDKTPSAAAWMTSFFEAGPWNETDEEGEEGEEPDDEGEDQAEGQEPGQPAA